MYLVKPRLAVGKRTVPGILSHMAFCEMLLGASCLSSLAGLKGKNELGLPFGDGYWWDVRSPSKFLFSTLLILLPVQSIEHTPQQIKGIWKSQVQTSFSQPRVLIFWGWHCFTVPAHCCKHHSGQAQQEQGFQRHHTKVAGWWLPQCSQGRWCCSFLLLFWGLGDSCKAFVKKMLQLENESVNALSPMHRPGEMSFPPFFHHI